MKWMKIFGGKWSFLTFSILADIHGRVFKDLFKEGPEPVLFTVKNGFSSFYYTEEGLEKFRQGLADLIREDSLLPSAMYDESLKTAEKIQRLVKKEKCESEDLRELIGLLYEFVPSYVFLKQCLEKLDDKKRYLELCEDSRKKTEMLWYDFEEFIIKFSKRNDLIKYCSMDELEIFLEKNELPNELEKRKKSLMIHDINKKIIRTGGEVDKFEKNLYSKLRFLRGNIAYPGKIKGKARIVLDPSVVDKFDKGNILITQMTRPDFLPLMKKASAIVTDAGGQLCHAAIVAREMKKCCIIDTNIATKFFSDGDIVRINGNKVRKIEAY